MAAEAGTVTFIYRGGGRNPVPRDATHVIMHESVTVISAEVFKRHPNIIEVYCHAGVKKVESEAFCECHLLKRVVMPGVEVVEYAAFCECEVLTYIECPKLERIGRFAFNNYCGSLSSIVLPSAKVVQQRGFSHCVAMKSASFGKNVESIEKASFDCCSSLERITIPLKNGLFGDEDDEIFQDCDHLTRIDLLEAEELDQTIAALHLEEWRNDMAAEIDSINLTLPNAEAGYFDLNRYEEVSSEKATAIDDWIYFVLRKIRDCEEQHVQLLKEVAETLQHVIPNSDIVIGNAVSFLELPTHTF